MPADLNSTGRHSLEIPPLMIDISNITANLTSDTNLYRGGDERDAAELEDM